MKILFLGLVTLLSGLLSPVQATSINLTPENEPIIFEISLDERLSVAELSGLSPPENLSTLSDGELANEIVHPNVAVEPSLIVGKS